MSLEPVEPATAVEVAMAVDASAAEPATALEPLEPATAEPAPMALEPAPEPTTAEPAPTALGKMQCPSCGKLLRIRTLAEKHTCARRPRKPWKMDPERLLARRRAAAERRFLARRGGEVVEVVGGSR